MKSASDLEGSDTGPPLLLISTSDVDDIVASRLPPEDKIPELIKMRERLGKAGADPEFSNRDVLASLNQALERLVADRYLL